MGLLQEAKGTINLVFVQVSLSVYCKHHSKVKHLLEVPKKTPPELKDNEGKNVYDYKEMVPSDVKKLFIYFADDGT